MVSIEFWDIEWKYPTSRKRVSAKNKRKMGFAMKICTLGVKNMLMCRIR